MGDDGSLANWYGVLVVHPRSSEIHSEKGRDLEPAILEGAEEFSFDGGPVGALLVHGFTGSPQGLRGLGEYLAERGLAVEGIRLPGHGTNWQDLNTRSSSEWVAAIEQGYSKLAQGRDKVFLVSLSFGSALAIDFAARHPEQVSGLVSLAGMVLVKDPRRFLSGVIRGSPHQSPALETTSQIRRAGRSPTTVCPRGPATRCCNSSSALVSPFPR